VSCLVQCTVLLYSLLLLYLFRIKHISYRIDIATFGQYCIKIVILISSHHYFVPVLSLPFLTVNEDISIVVGLMH